MEQDWINGLIGGVLIGLAGAVFLLGNGRIMGASGIIGGLVDGSGKNNVGERVSFIVALIAVPTVMMLLFAPDKTTHVTSNWFVLVAAGLCVGIGTRIANGCTSGHGVCGISRMSLRGIVATVFYILAGGIAMVLFRHILGII